MFGNFPFFISITSEQSEGGMKQNDMPMYYDLIGPYKLI